MPKSPRLRQIVVAYAINELGTWFAYMALSVAVYDQTHSALAVSGMFISARLIPALLVPALVARVETSRRRGELAGLYLSQALTVSALIYVLDHFWLPGVLLLVAVNGAAALTAAALLRAAAARTAVAELEPTPADPDGAAAQPSAESEERSMIAQRRANAAINVAWTATVALGPALGGVIVDAAGVSVALLIDVASFVICAAMLAGLRTHVEEIGRVSVRVRLQAALDHLRTMPVLRRLLEIEALALVFFASVEPVEVIYAKHSLGAGDLGFGLLVGVWGAGMVLGGVAFSRSLRRPLGPMLTAGTLMVGIAYLASAGAPSLAFACCASVVGGVGNGIQWASLISAVQQLTPSALLGRLMSAVEAMGALCPAIGFVIGGTVTALSSPRGALLLAGVAATTATGVFYRMTRRSDVLMRPLRAGPTEEPALVAAASQEPVA